MSARQSGNVKVVRVTWGLRYSRRTLTEVWRVIAWRGVFLSHSSPGQLSAMPCAIVSEGAVIGERGRRHGRQEEEGSSQEGSSQEDSSQEDSSQEDSRRPQGRGTGQARGRLRSR